MLIFTISEQKIVVRTKSAIPLSLNSSVYFQAINDSYGIISVNTKTSKTQQLQQLQASHSNQEFIEEPVLIYKDGVEQIVIGEMTIKLKSGLLKDIMNAYSYSSVSDLFVENQYKIKFDELSTKEIFELTNRLNQSHQVEFAEPNFVRLLKPHTTNDDFYNDQWAIENTGQLSGNVDADMDVDLALEYFNLETGYELPSIDEGVDLTHPDLNANMLAGFDATDRTENGGPWEARDDAHGTACAGIVAAQANNNEGIAGVAFNSEIIPVRIAYSLYLMVKRHGIQTIHG